MLTDMGRKSKRRILSFGRSPSSTRRLKPPIYDDCAMKSHSPLVAMHPSFSTPSTSSSILELTTRLALLSALSAIRLALSRAASPTLVGALYVSGLRHHGHNRPERFRLTIFCGEWPARSRLYSSISWDTVSCLKHRVDVDRVPGFQHCRPGVGRLARDDFRQSCIEIYIGRIPDPTESGNTIH